PILVHGLLGGGAFGNLWLYIVGPLLGGAIAAAVFKMQEGKMSKVQGAKYLFRTLHLGLWTLDFGLTRRRNYSTRRGPRRWAPGVVQRVHDLRLVRAPAEPGGPAMVHRGDRQLGHRALRVSAPGPREPHRLHGADAGATQDHAGGDHADRLCALRG